MYKYLFNLFLGVLLLSGCATARLSKGPDVFSLLDHPKGLRVGIARVADERGTTSAGTIGAEGIKVKEDVVDLTTNYLINYLNERMAANIVRIQNVDPQQIPALASEKNIDRILLAKIKKLKMFSMDAVMQPVEVDADLEVSVYDKKGDEIFNETISGHYEKRLGMFTIVEKDTGELVEATIKEAMNNLVKTPSFQEVLAGNPTQNN